MRQRLTPELFIITGLSGSGKSSVAHHISWEVGGRWVNSDWIRKHLSKPFHPTYSREESERVYETMFNAAHVWLSLGDPVVLDGTFSLRSGRDRATMIGRGLKARTKLVHVVADKEIVIQRLINRLSGSGRIPIDVSDAGVDVYLGQIGKYEQVMAEEGAVIFRNEYKRIEDLHRAIDLTLLS